MKCIFFENCVRIVPCLSLKQCRRSMDVYMWDNKFPHKFCRHLSYKAVFFFVFQKYHSHINLSSVFWTDVFFSCLCGFCGLMFWFFGPIFVFEVKCISETPTERRLLFLSHSSSHSWLINGDNLYNSALLWHAMERIGGQLECQEIPNVVMQWSGLLLPGWRVLFIRRRFIMFFVRLFV